MNRTGLLSRMAAISNPLASYGLEGATTLMPGTFTNQASRLCECWAAAPVPEPEPALPDAPLVDAKPAMAALEKKVDEGVKVDLGKPSLENGVIVLPFEVQSRNAKERYQLRVTINTNEPAAKRFKVMVKGFK